MHSLEELSFAQHFPFSNAAKRVVGEKDLSLENLPEPVIERAELMVRHALLGKDYSPNLQVSELLLNEILAFPVAKILVSFVREQALFRNFSSMVAKSGYLFLSSEKEGGKIALELASDLGLKFDFPEDKSFFVSLPLKEFLSIPINEDSLKLVNQFLSNGLVSLELNTFQKFLRQKSFNLVFSSLPVPVKGLPKRLENIAKGLKQASKQREQKLFKTAFKGKASPSSFPPCISSMYSQLASGQKLAHMANFTLATFLNSIGMPTPQILALFKKAPNFKERTASYQLNRIAKQNYSPPSCEKIKSYGICPDKACRARHPLSYYKRELAKNFKSKEKTEKPSPGSEGPAVKSQKEAGS